MRKIGLFMTLVAVIVIGYNVYIGKKSTEMMNESPWTTLLTGGANLPNQGRYYSFTPPLTNFETIVYVVLLAGVGILMFGKDW